MICQSSGGGEERDRDVCGVASGKNDGGGGLYHESCHFDRWENNIIAGIRTYRNTRCLFL